jgi:branched-chain amino acid transport system substrate-binding protein
MKKLRGAGWCLGWAVATTMAASSCNRQPEPAVIVVVHGATDAVRTAQVRIVETSRDGEPVIRVQHEGSVVQSIEAEFDQSQWAIEQPDVVTVVGHESSASSLAAAPFYREAGLPFLVPTATTPLLDDIVGTFPLPPNDSMQGAFLADFAHDELGATTATIFYVNDQYGVGLHEGVVRQLDLLGVRVLDLLPILPESDIQVMVEASLARHVPDVIIAAVRTPDVWTLSRWAQELTQGLPVVAGDGAYVRNLVPDVAGPSADSVYVSVFWHFLTADSAASAFIQDFRQVSGRDPSPADAMVFDAIMLAATAIRHVGTNPTAVQRYLTELGVTHPPYGGVTGEIQFSADRDRPLIMVRPRDGQFVPLDYEP